MKTGSLSVEFLNNMIDEKPMKDVTNISLNELVGRGPRKNNRRCIIKLNYPSRTGKSLKWF